MTLEFTEAIKARGLPLAGLIETGGGFRVGELPFVVTQRSPGHWRHRNDACALVIDSELQWQGACAVITRRLHNEGESSSPPLDVLEPLQLEFAHPAEQWRHIYANGGTSENFYPPTAYRTQECSRLRPRTWPRSSLLIESAPTGRSSNLHLPFIISLASTDRESEGLFCGMEWLGAWSIGWGEAGDGRSVLRAGPKVSGLQLAPGESLDLPAVHLGFFRGGPAAGTNALRRHLYTAVCPGYQGRPVLPRVSYDHWFGIHNRFDAELLTREARRAAELGVETFVIDAAWFPGDFPEGVGNWDAVDRRKFPAGLEPFADTVRSLGMDFGLWFEPERAVAGTTWVREHPQWFVPVARVGDPNTVYHIDLSKREVQDFVIEQIGRWISRLDIRWSRWDYNIEPAPYWSAVDPTLKVQFAYMAGLYRVLDTLMREHPNWMVEGCASGGRRIDIGTMKRAHTYWFSDQSVDPFICRYMQARANRFLPGHLLNSSVAVGLGAGDAGFDDVAVLSRMLGKLAFDGDIASWSPQLARRMAEWVKEFKAARHLMVQDFHQLLPTPATAEDWDAVEFVSYDGGEAALFAFAGAEGGSRRLSLHGLEPAQRYTVTRRPDGAAAALSGAELMETGLPVELPSFEAGMWSIKQ